MDIPRPNAARDRRRRRIAYAATTLVLLTLVTVGLSRLKPAAPTVERGSFLPDVVKRGPMLREVHGNGTLVPEQIQYVQADTDGRVERILVLAGAEVQSDTLLLELSNPELKQAAFDAEWAVKAGEAQFTKLKVQLQSDRLSQEATAASVKASYSQAELEAEADEELVKDGLVAKLTAKRSRSIADELKNRFEIEKQRLDINVQASQAQLDAHQAELEKLRALLELKRKQVAALQVRAGIDGVVQQVGDLQTLQVGQRISPSVTLAKIVQPTRLKAEIKIAETQAKEVLIGQRARIDTRPAIIPGRVVRVDPAAQNGTVTVDVKLEGALPRGARPDLSVDGTIELERLEDVLYVGKPVQGQTDSTVGLFKIVEGGKEAIRVKVRLGRSSVSVIEVIEGLQLGDQVILSDMSQWDAHDRLRIN